MQFTIDKAKFLKGETVEVSYHKTDDKGAKGKAWEGIDAPVHEDLKAAFHSLAIHLAVLCGYVKPKQIKNIEQPAPELSESFHVTSFSIGGGDDSPGIVISGHMLLPDGKAVILNSPFRRFEESEESRYVYMEDLREKLERLDKELRAYLDGSKRGADNQLNLFEGQAADKKEVVNKAQILPPDKKLFNTPGAGKWPEADPEAMERVAAGGIEDAEVIEETQNAAPAQLTDAKPEGKKKRVKKVAQSAAAPSGMIEDADPLGVNE